MELILLIIAAIFVGLFLGLAGWLLYAILFNPKKIPCDHLYFPYPEYEEPIGQKCAFCGKFNSLKDLGMKSNKEEMNE